MEEYLEYMKDFVVPEGCIIAGGAIANTIISHVWGIDAPVRDVDVYHFETVRNDPGIINYLATGYVGTKLGNYTISDVAEWGFYHHIYLKTAHKIGNRLLVVEDFDLNCVQVAYDGQHLYWTPAFEEFLETRKIEITNVHNVKTYYRVLKKARDLKATFNEKKVDELFAQLSWAIDKRLFDPRVTDKYVDYLGENGWSTRRLIAGGKVIFPRPEYHLGDVLSVLQIIELVNWLFTVPEPVRKKFLDVIARYPYAGVPLRQRPSEFRMGTTMDDWGRLNTFYANRPLVYSKLTDQWSFTDDVEMPIAEQLKIAIALVEDEIPF